MNLDWELIMKTIRPFFIISLCLIFLSNPVLAESLFNDVPDEPDLEMTCDKGKEVSFQKTGDNLGLLWEDGYISLDLVESDEKGKRYIYGQNGKLNYGMVDFKKLRWYFDYDKPNYEECW